VCLITHDVVTSVPRCNFCHNAIPSSGVELECRPLTYMNQDLSQQITNLNHDASFSGSLPCLAGPDCAAVPAREEVHIVARNTSVYCIQGARVFFEP